MPGVPTFEGSPPERRLALLAPLAEVDADRYCTFSVMRANDALYFTHVASTGDACAVDLTRSIEGRRYYGPWDPGCPPPGAMNRFRPGIDGWGDDEHLRELPIWKYHYGPAGLRWERRMLTYSAGHFVAWLGVTRYADRRPFSREETARLQRLVPRLVRLAVAEAALRSDGASDQSCHAVLRPDGTVDGACHRAAAWLDAERADRLGRATRRLDAGEDVLLVIGETRASPVRLVAPDGRVSYLWSLTPLETPKLAQSSMLTPREREVAELAAVGATVSEIARHLSIGEETVRSHLKRAYAALGVASRVELARSLAD